MTYNKLLIMHDFLTFTIGTLYHFNQQWILGKVGHLLIVLP